MFGNEAAKTYLPDVDIIDKFKAEHSSRNDHSFNRAKKFKLNKLKSNTTIKYTNVDIFIFNLLKSNIKIIDSKIKHELNKNIDIYESNLSNITNMFDT